MKTSFIVPLAIALAFALGACLPAASSTAQPDVAASEAPVEVKVNAKGTAKVLAETMVAETLQALPTPTLFVPPEPAALEPTPTPSPDPLAILTSLPVTPTTVPPATLAPLTLVPPTAVGTPWTCDKIPTFVERGYLVIENLTHKSIYVSLFGVTRPHEYHACYGLTLRHSTSLDIPLGEYTYVAIVGGAKFVGTFSYKTANKMVLTIHKDRVSVH